MAITVKVPIDSKGLPNEGFEEKLKSEIKQENIDEITQSVEFDVEIKEEPIESKDLKETECILKKKELIESIEIIESIETSVSYENEVENFVDLYKVKSETKNIAEYNLEEDPLQIPGTNCNAFEDELRIELSERLEDEINIEPNFYLKKEGDSVEKSKDLTKSSVVPQKLFQCNVCDSDFSLRARLKVHIESVHKEKKPFICNDCGASFFQKGHLNRHVKSVHSGIKPFKCNNCDSSFSQKENLNGHIKSVHEGKKPFKCNDCDASFSRKLVLNRHIKTVHEEKKPVKCNVCEKVFSDKANLRVHIGSVHKGTT